MSEIRNAQAMEVAYSNNASHLGVRLRNAPAVGHRNPIPPDLEVQLVGDPEKVHIGSRYQTLVKESGGSVVSPHELQILKNSRFLALQTIGKSSSAVTGRIVLLRLRPVRSAVGILLVPLHRSLFPSSAPADCSCSCYGSGVHGCGGWFFLSWYAGCRDCWFG